MQRERKAVYRLAYVVEYLKDAETILRSEMVKGNNGKLLQELDIETLLEVVAQAHNVARQVMTYYYRPSAPGQGVQVTRREAANGESRS